jgi:uncharacterized protein YndB with AHSA1/START domain
MARQESEMATAFHRAEIDAPPDRVWAVVRDFAAIDSWHPLVRKSIGETRAPRAGDTRTLTMLDGVVVHERLVEVSNTGKRLTYTWLDPPPIPVARSTIRMRVIPLSRDRTRVEIDGSFAGGQGGAAEEAARISQDTVWPAALRGLNALLALGDKGAATLQPEPGHSD